MKDSRRVPAPPRSERSRPSVALRGQDRVQEQLLGEAAAAEREAHGVDEEGPVVLEQLHDAAPRAVGRRVDAELQLAGRALRDQLEGLTGELREGGRASRAHRAGVGAREQRAGERQEDAALGRAHGLGRRGDRRLEGLPCRLRCHRRGSVAC